MPVFHWQTESSLSFGEPCPVVNGEIRAVYLSVVLFYVPLLVPRPPVSRAPVSGPIPGWVVSWPRLQTAQGMSQGDLKGWLRFFHPEERSRSSGCFLLQVNATELVRI